jgi:hypothetical protein
VIEAVVAFLESLAATPWFLVAVIAIAMVDSVWVALTRWVLGRRKVKV